MQRHFLTVLGGDTVKLDDKHSGRLELAEWITRPTNPLVARVEVNRIWEGHFGQGLVKTADNWGLMGDRPEQTELLDWLAATFVEDGWSIKKMQRRIMLSSAYQMSCANDSKAMEIDPDNRLCWRMNRQRLDAEPFRDAILAVSGKLDLAMGGSLLTTGDNDYVTNDQSANQAQYGSPRRSIYLPVIRNALFDMFQAFDFGDPSMTHAFRTSTTVAPQALYVMNSPFVIEQSRSFAQRAMTHEAKSDAERIEWAYEQALGREPTSFETVRANNFLIQYESMLTSTVKDPAMRRTKAWQSLCQVLFASNEFIYLN